MQPVVNEAVGAALVRTTETGTTTEPCVPSSSVTVRVTSRVPEVRKSYDAVDPEAVPRPPKSQL